MFTYSNVGILVVVLLITRYSLMFLKSVLPNRPLYLTWIRLLSACLSLLARCSSVPCILSRVFTTQRGFVSRTLQEPVGEDGVKEFKLKSEG